MKRFDLVEDLVNTADRTHDKPAAVVTKPWQWFGIYEMDTFAMLRGDWGRPSRKGS